MDNFIKAMLKEGYNFKKVEYGGRIYNHIPTKSGYKLSIQCSSFHYCEPTKLIPIQKYKTYEVAILINNEFTQPNLNGFIHEMKEYDCGGVYGYVPKQIVEDLYNFLNKEGKND